MVATQLLGNGHVVRAMPTGLLLSLAAVLVLASPAAAADKVLTTVAEDTPLSAYGGHVVWSAPVAGGYGLVHWHNGQLEPLPVAPRSVPFDVDVGSDARGRAVAMYSRCREEPRVDDLDSWTIAGGCDVYAYTLEGAGRERRVRRVSRRSSSETTPSMWRGAIAFARRGRGERVARLYVRRPGARSATRLSGGSVPSCEDIMGRCRPRAGAIAIDLGARNAAVLWQLVGGNVVGTSVGCEVRVASLDGRRSRLAGAGWVSGTCGLEIPLSPNVSGAAEVTFLNKRGECTLDRTPFVVDDPARRTRRRWSPPEGVFAHHLARDGDVLYWLRGRDCQPCELVRSTGLRFERVRRPRLAPPLF